jgi:hypothetical protein
MGHVQDLDRHLLSLDQASGHVSPGWGFSHAVLPGLQVALLPLVTLFVRLLLTVSQEVTGVPTPPAHRLQVPALLVWGQWSSPWHPVTHLMQPCMWSSHCLCRFKLQGRAEGFIA